jgi:hypothetical protein
MTIAEATEAEAALDIPALVQHALDRIEVVDFGEPIVGGRHPHALAAAS